MATPNVGRDIPFIVHDAVNNKYYNQVNGHLVEVTAEEYEQLSKGLSGTPEPVGDTAPKRTPQPGEKVKIVAKDARGKGGSAHYYVTDELGNQYEVDKKTYNSIKKGKGFVDGGQLKPVSEGAPKPIAKPVDVLKGEQSQARREVRNATAEAERAVSSQQSVDARKEALKQEYKTAQKEMKEARKALVEAINKEGGDIEGASSRFKTATSKFKNVSREYKAVCRELQNAIGRTTRAVTTLENAKTRSAEITKERDAAKAAERKAAAEAEAARQARHDAKIPKTQNHGGVPTEAEAAANNAERAAERAAAGEGTASKILTEGEGAASKALTTTEEAASKVVTETESTASKALTATEEAASKVKGGGKWGKIIGWGVAALAATIGIGATVYYATKSDDKVETPSDEVPTEETATETTTEEGTAATEETEGTAETTTTPSAEEVAATQAANEQDLAEVEADDAEFSQPITVQPGDCLWNICKQDLKEKNNGKEPTNAEIAEAVMKVMEKNEGSLKFESDGSRVLIYAGDTFDQDGTYHRNI